LQGSYFQRTVVLICRHDAQGAFGLVLNRTSGGLAGDAVVANLSENVRNLPLFMGGPVQPQALSYLSSDSFEVGEGNIMAQLDLDHSLDKLIELGESFSPGRRIKVFAGYAGWDAGQLEREMARKDWLTYPASLDLVFFEQPDQLWQTILHRIGPKFKLLADSPEDLSWN